MREPAPSAMLSSALIDSLPEGSATVVSSETLRPARLMVAPSVARGRGRAGAGDRQRAAGLDRHHRTGLAGQERRADQQVAAAIAPAVLCVVAVLFVIDRQPAPGPTRDHLGGVQGHGGKAQQQALGRHQIVRQLIRRGLQPDRVGHDVQLAVPELVQHGAAGRLRLGGADIDAVAVRGDRARPDEFAGGDGGRVARRAIAVDGRRAQHQPLQRASAAPRASSATAPYTLIDSFAFRIRLSSAGAPSAVLPRSSVASTSWFISRPGGRWPAAPACCKAWALPRLTADTLSARLRVPYCTVSRQVKPPLVAAPMDPSDSSRDAPPQAATQPPTSMAVPAPPLGAIRFTSPFDTASKAPEVSA